MKNSFIIFSFVLCWACGDKKPTLTPIDSDSLTTVQKDSLIETFDFDFSQAIHQDSSDFLLIPLSSPLLNSQYSRKGFISSGSGYANDYASWNIFFYNYQTNGSKLLTDKKIRIEKYDHNLFNGGLILSNSILYKVIEEDTDENNFLDNDDEIGLFISSSSGTNFRRLTPKGENFDHYKIIPKTDKLIIRTSKIITKSNETKVRFKRKIYLLDLANETDLIELMDSINRQKIEEIYFDNWLKK